MDGRNSTNDELAVEAAKWVGGELDAKTWEDAPHRVPRVAESEAISIRMPKELLVILREFARREGIGYQVLIKRWLDDRIREEAAKLKAGKAKGPARATPDAVMKRLDDLESKLDSALSGIRNLAGDKPA